MLDTNVLVSATFWKGEAFKLLQLAMQGKFDCYSSLPILEEYFEVISSEEIVAKTQKRKLAADAAITDLIRTFSLVRPERKIFAVKEDPDDNKILECALEAKVDFIVSYDEGDLLSMREFEGVKLLSPSEFLKILSPN